MKREVTSEETYNGYPIQAKAENGWECYTDILQQTRKLFERSLEKHSKILLFRFDVRYPNRYNPKNNVLFQGFLENYVRYLKRKGYDPQYIWCTEVGAENGKLHHHAAMVLNANAKQFMPSSDRLRKLWYSALYEPEDWYDLLIRPSYPTPGSILSRSGSIIRRGDNEALSEAIYWTSYLAKVSTKDLAHGVRSFGCSQI